MKEKIFTALKASVVDGNGKTSISDRTLNAYAERLSTQITEESQIAQAIKPDVIVLKEIAGNISAVAADAVKAVKPLEKPLEKVVEKVIDPNEPAWFTAFKEQQRLETEELKLKVTGFEKERTTEALTSKVKNRLKEKGVDEDWLIGRNLAVESEDVLEQKVDEVATNWATYVQRQAEKGVVINVPQNAQGNVAEGKFGSKIAELKNAGASEGAEGKKILINN